MFDCKNISVIVQGGINRKETPACLKSVRRVLPGAQIILSTWEGSDTTGLDYDVLVLNQDPGAEVICQINGKNVLNNVNRQLLSTQEGLKRAERKYALKLRTDLILTDDRFLNYFDEFQARGDEYRLFKHKILTSVLFNRKFIKVDNNSYNTPFHISDWWFFGLKEDLEKYFIDTPFVKEPEFSNYFNIHKEKINPYGNIKFQFSPEQYFGYKCFERNFGFHMKDASEVTPELVEKSEKFLVNNFIVLEYEQSGVYLKKYSYSKNEVLAGEQYFGLYNFYEYENLYKKICNPDYQITCQKRIFVDKEFGKDYMRICKHIFTICNPQKSFSKRIENLFIGLPVALVMFFVKQLGFCKKSFNSVF